MASASFPSPPSLTTHYTANNDLLHVLENVMHEPPDGDVLNALLRGAYYSVPDHFGMTFADLAHLTFEQLSDDNQSVNVIPLQYEQCRSIHALTYYIRHLRSTNSFISYTMLTSKGFDQYKATTYDHCVPCLPKSYYDNVPLPTVHARVFPYKNGEHQNEETKVQSISACIAPQPPQKVVLPSSIPFPCPTHLINEPKHTTQTEHPPFTSNINDQFDTLVLDIDTNLASSNSNIPCPPHCTDPASLPEPITPLVPAPPPAPDLLACAMRQTVLAGDLPNVLSSPGPTNNNWTSPHACVDAPMHPASIVPLWHHLLDPICANLQLVIANDATTPEPPAEPPPRPRPPPLSTNCTSRISALRVGRSTCDNTFSGTTVATSEHKYTLHDNNNSPADGHLEMITTCTCLAQTTMPLSSNKNSASSKAFPSFTTLVDDSTTHQLDYLLRELHLSALHGARYSILWLSLLSIWKLDVLANAQTVPTTISMPHNTIPIDQRSMLALLLCNCMEPDNPIEPNITLDPETASCALPCSNTMTKHSTLRDRAMHPMPWCVQLHLPQSILSILQHTTMTKTSQQSPFNPMILPCICLRLEHNGTTWKHTESNNQLLLASSICTPCIPIILANYCPNDPQHDSADMVRLCQMQVNDPIAWMNGERPQKQPNKMMQSFSRPSITFLCNVLSTITMIMRTARHCSQLEQPYGNLSTMRNAFTLIGAPLLDNLVIPDMLSYLVNPLIGHLDCFCFVCDYPYKTMHEVVYMPDYLDPHDHHFDWTYPVYGEKTNVLPANVLSNTLITYSSDPSIQRKLICSYNVPAPLQTEKSICNHTQIETSNQVTNLCFVYLIDYLLDYLLDYLQSKMHCRHWNMLEPRWGVTKKPADILLIQYVSPNFVPTNEFSVHNPIAIKQQSWILPCQESVHNTLSLFDPIKCPCLIPPNDLLCLSSQKTVLRISNILSRH